MNKRKIIKIIVVVSLVGIATAGEIVYYMFNMPHRDVASIKIDLTLTSSELVAEYLQNASVANDKYLDTEGESKILEISGIVSSSDNGIKFHQGTWNEALALAKQENKIIFLDVYATWCGPCKQLKKNTFSDENVGVYYNEHFINVIVDGEKGEGAEIAKEYNVRAYPTLLFIDANGSLISEKKGYYAPNDFLKIGKTVVKHNK